MLQARICLVDNAAQREGLRQRLDNLVRACNTVRTMPGRSLTVLWLPRIYGGGGGMALGARTLGRNSAWTSMLTWRLDVAGKVNPHCLAHRTRDRPRCTCPWLRSTTAESCVPGSHIRTTQTPWKTTQTPWATVTTPCIDVQYIVYSNLEKMLESVSKNLFRWCFPFNLICIFSRLLQPFGFFWKLLYFICQWYSHYIPITSPLYNHLPPWNHNFPHKHWFTVTYKYNMFSFH